MAEAEAALEAAAPKLVAIAFATSGLGSAQITRRGTTRPG